MAADLPWLTVKPSGRLEIETRQSHPHMKPEDFDELVLGHHGKCWLHVEILDRNSVFVSIADRRFWLHLTRKGARITNEEKDAR